MFVNRLCSCTFKKVYKRPFVAITNSEVSVQLQTYAAQRLEILLPILELPASNIGSDTGNSDFSSLFLSVART